MCDDLRDIRLPVSEIIQRLFSKAKGERLAGVPLRFCLLRRDHPAALGGRRTTVTSAHTSKRNVVV